MKQLQGENCRNFGGIFTLVSSQLLSMAYFCLKPTYYVKAGGGEGSQYVHEYNYYFATGFFKK